MNLAENKTILALLFATVIISGCTGGGSTEQDTSTSAVQVNEFSAFPNPTPSGQNTRFRMQVENVGDHDAENVYAQLYGPPFASEDGQSNTWRSSGGDAVSSSDRLLEFSDLSAPQENTPSTPSTQTVTFTAPELDDGREIGYNMRARLMYKYGTDATSEIQVMGEDAYQEAGSPQGSATIQNDDGPVQMEIRTPTPIAIYNSGQDSVEKELCVVVRNQGAGVPFTDDDGDDTDAFKGEGNGYNLEEVQEHTNKVKLTIENVGRVEFRKDDDGSYDESVSSQTKEIIGGRAVVCWDMRIQTGTSALDTTIPLSIESTYFYKQESSSAVTVQGR
ncbi:hypothetical protein ACK3SF_00405 [Candidatus Nanosalina sp. VS9-1]|uniref:hypothetical protein n=1 Tax=Candidatus Nanosalina sp. VS9-1 TaxID=3388566 RepID=UPI0039E0DCB9